MQLEQITMDRNDARKAFLEYRHAVRERHDREDEQIMRGYRAMAQGHQLVRLSETMRVGGTQELTFPIRQWNGRRDPCDYRVPRLAVCRADAKVCFTFGVGEDGGCLFTADRPGEDEYMALLQRHQQLWAVNRDLVDRLSQRLSWVALTWCAGGFWSGIFIGLIVR